MLDRYVQDSADNAHASSRDGSYDSETDGDSQASTAVGSEAGDAEADDQLNAADDAAHVARLSVEDSPMESSTAAAASCYEQDHQDQRQISTHNDNQDQHVSDSEPQTDVTDRHVKSEAVPEQLPVDLPDHVAVRARAKQNAPRAAAPHEAEQNLDDSSMLSHSTQIPSQAAVKQRVLDQQRSRMRRQVLAKASRNAQKVGNKKERKQTADSVNW